MNESYSRLPEEVREILSHVDHTNLSVTATEEEIRRTVQEAVFFHTAAVCIPPRFFRAAVEEAGGRVSICTVIGFPNGYMTATAKAAEAEEAIRNGADELDTVIPLGAVKAGRYGEVLSELILLRRVTAGKILKVIIETSALTDEEKKKLCGIVSESGADYIKTSTGFHTGGATKEDVALLRAYISPSVRVKAAGGISSFRDAATFLALGADRLGTSRLVKIAIKM